MSLEVNVRVYDKNGEYTEIELENGKQLAGFERCRYNLYGSDLAKRSGFRLLTELKEKDLYVEFEMSQELESELNVILERIKEFSQTSGLGEDYIRERVNNILNAVQIAKNVRGMTNG